MKETPQEYAQRRANETCRPYLITGMGHVWWACSENRKTAQEMENGILLFGGIAQIIRPEASNV